MDGGAIPREYVIYHAATGKTMAIAFLKALEENLPANFMRIHKSYIVAKDTGEILLGIK
ncbi:LytTR family DNA-binding domain-containing protein [Lewinella sp. 4G2]|uniref:LytTR family DNA-binding domain-containing protein n=1 Tax=Lewinella sp. 4G2 TaxID=1803372 RepID=UPI0009ED3195|nr:LytTR family DNA-binding domain-containing protein [Lewinella sp. 4G2]